MTNKVIALIFILSTISLYAGNYTVDKVHSKVGFKIKYIVVSSVAGQFTKFSGFFKYNEKRKILKSLHWTANTNSIDTKNNKRDKHLKSIDFFNADKYPKMTFVLHKANATTAYGKLTFHGVTKNIKMVLRITHFFKEKPEKKLHTKILLSGSINRRDFGLNWNKKIGLCDMMISDIVVINAELDGVPTP